MSFYPFNREINSFAEHKSGLFTITGQVIVESYHVGLSSDGKIDPEFDFDTANPQIFKPEFLIRSRMEVVYRNVFNYLLYRKNRSIPEILIAAKNIRNMFWESIDAVSEISELPSDYYTGIQAGDLGPKSYRTWSIMSDPFMFLEISPENWLEMDI